MTFIIGLVCSNGVILAADSQLSAGNYRREGRKIYQFGNNIIWGAAGMITDEFREEINGLADTNGGSSLHELSGAIRDIAVAVLEAAHKRHEIFHGEKDDAPDLASLFVEWNDGQPAMLHIDDTGAMEWCEEWSGSWQGCGMTEAFGPVYPLIRPHDVREIPVDKGQILAYRVMEEVTHCMNGDVGGPVQLMTAVGVTTGKRNSTWLHP